MRNSRNLLVICFFITLLPGCSSRTENPVGVTLPDDDWYGQGPFVDTLALEESESVLMDESAGAAPFLLVGSGNGLTSRALVRFSVLPAAARVQVARLELTAGELVGTDEIRLDIFGLTNSLWEETGVTWDLLSGTTEEDPVYWNIPGGDFDSSAPLGSLRITSADIDSTLEVSLDTSLVQAWIDSTDANTGIILVARGEGGETGFRGFLEMSSRQSPGEGDEAAPHLYLEYEREDLPDSIVSGSILVGEDATIYDYAGEVPEDLLRVGSVPQYRTFLMFPTDSLPPALMVRKARLELSVAARVPEDRELAVAALRIVGDWDGASTSLEFTTIDTVEVGTEGTVDMDVTSLVWSWVSGTLENDGVAVKATVERGRYVYADFFLQAPGEPPRCIIEYTLPPETAKEPQQKVKVHE